MIVNMLRAVSKMLIGNDAATEVKCARIMLEEIIKGMEAKAKSPAEVERAAELLVEEALSIPKKDKPKPEKEPKESQPLITVDANRKLLPIKNLPLDAKLKLDGKIMTHKEAIGLSFTRIERVD